MDWKLELVILPVSDVDRAKTFYVEKLGFNVDVDHRAGDTFRVVQLTPPGSACSISIGRGITDAAPGSVRGLHLVVVDIEAAQVPGPDPQRQDYGSFLSFSDPDGNSWVVQEVRHGEPRA